MSKTRKIFRKNVMRKITEMQLKIGQVPISDIKIDLLSRDEIPQLLMGLQAIDSNRKLRDEVFKILRGIVPKKIDPDNGRPGMDLWKILVLGVLRLNSNWDYDKLHHIANEHKTVREFLGHTIYEFDRKYALQTIKDNLRLLSPEILDKISRLAVRAGHKLKGASDLSGRCDSFVVETDVHFPTDINLLLDAVRKILAHISRACSEAGVAGWRQHRHNYRKIKKKFNRINKMKRSTSKSSEKKAIRDALIMEAHQEYIDLAGSYVERAGESLKALKHDFENTARAMVVEHFVSHANRQINQIRRRVIQKETIPHHEKVFSIFEEHTEWISKGKAGVRQELGLRVCVLEDQYGFILHHHVMEKQTDEKVTVSMVEQTKSKFPGLRACSFDKGFYSPDTARKLKKYLDLVILPKKGALSKKDKEVEHSPDFIAGRRRHSAVESGINALENHGLDICRDHGIFGFKRYVALSVTARNIQILGAMIQKKRLKRIKRRKGQTPLRQAA
ncbi:transposase [Candidatus Desulfarcum epimagneticum]|uniref:Transposase n=1 Tax=uncultured Desulfobacteraceae bacterium TaxID=218296 RepID=A0A484HHZ6_9BACT|nr:transposase [uncultured Desulfobacteraceae bacterium]VEN74034.1 transposase [uncultured Desulfobacteraceae bacterium]